jgi:hypothetical protein
MGRRFLAFTADCGVLGLFAFVVVALISFSDSPVTDEIRRSLGRIAVILWLLYMVVASYFKQMTVGKYLLGVELQSTRPGSVRPLIWELAMRETVFRWMSLIMLIGYIPAFSDARHRSWSDRWANTVVVRRNVKPRRWIVGLFAFTILGILLLAGLVVLVGWTRY